MQPQPQPKRKRKLVTRWIRGGIACVLLIAIILTGYLLTGHSFPLGAGHSFPLGGCSLPSLTGNNAPHPTLTSAYSGAFVGGGPGEPMQLNSVNENQQGAICGTLVLGTLANNSHPFTGTVGTDNSVTFTATLASMTVLTTFQGVVNTDGSIWGSSTTPDGYFAGTWAISPK